MNSQIKTVFVSKEEKFEEEKFKEERFEGENFEEKLQEVIDIEANLENQWNTFYNFVIVFGLIALFIQFLGNNGML